MTSTYFILLLLSSLLSVNTSEVENPTTVSISSDQFKEVEIHSKEMGGWVNDNVFMPTSMAIKDGFLIIYEDDFSLDDKLIKIYSINEEEKVGYYGKSGRGPGEIQGGLQTIPSYGEGSNISFYDFSRKRAGSVNIESILNDGSYIEPHVQKTFPSAFVHMQFATIVNDSLVLGSNSILEGKFALGNLNNQDFQFTPFTPSVGIDVDNLISTNIYMHDIFINENKQRIVVANNFFNQIEIYNYQGEKKLIIKGDDSEQQFDLNRRNSNSWRLDNTIQYYDGVFANDEYIFALYYGKAYSEIREPNGLYKETTKSTIKIFDWTGKPIKKLNLDRRLTYAVYDEYHQRLIGIDRDSLNPMVEISLEL